MTKYELPEQPPEWSSVRDKHGEVWIRTTEGWRSCSHSAELIGTWGEFLQRAGPAELLSGGTGSVAESAARWSSLEAAQKVLDHLIDTSDHSQTSASIREVGKAVNIGRNTAFLALRRLVDNGHVEVIRPGTGDGYRTIYRIVGDGPAT